MTALAAALLALAAGAANPLTADRLPPALLAECDARAAPYERFEPPVAAAAKALIDIGAFRREDFLDVAAGFCALQAADGPVAATSCGDGVILLDEKYADPREALSLRATLAHEMIHHRQHKEKKGRFGAGYCASLRYAADKSALEAEADAYGEKVAALLVTGRGVEIVNSCDASISVYLEAEDPVAVRERAASFERVEAKSRKILDERARSGAVRFYARSAPAAGTVHVWQDIESAETRFVEGRLARLKRMRLTAPDGLHAPFRLRLECRVGER